MKKVADIIKAVFKSQSDDGPPNPDIEEIFKSCLRSLDSGETSLSEEGITQFAHNNSVPAESVPEFVSRVVKHKNMQKSTAGQEGAEAGAFNDAQLEELKDAFTEIQKSFVIADQATCIAAGEIVESYEPRLKALEEQSGEMQEIIKSRDETIEALQSEIEGLKKSTAELGGEIKDPKDVGLEGGQQKPQTVENTDEVMAMILKGKEAGELTGDDVIAYNLQGRKTEAAKRYLKSIQK